MQTIPVSAAVACTQLLGECTELGDDPDAWQDHLVDGAERLIGGSTTAFKILRVPAGEPVFDEAMLSRSSDDHLRFQFGECLREGGHKDMPELTRLMPFVYSTGEVAFRYSDLTGGLRAFHDSAFYDRYLRCLGVGDALAANNAQPTGHVVSLWVMRQRSERSFSASPLPSNTSTNSTERRIPEAFASAALFIESNVVPRSTTNDTSRTIEGYFGNGAYRAGSGASSSTACRSISAMYTGCLNL